MISSFIGYSLDEETRFRTTSGGVGTSILKYMFDNEIIQTSISFDFNSKTLKYEPKLIYKFIDYQITGSIYQEIDMYNFIKENIPDIKGEVFLFLLPCQVRPLSYLLNKNNIKHFIIALTCSSQQSIEATYYLLKRINIDKKDVKLIKYRGNGWPGGITIQLENREDIFIPNNNSIWTDIFHSRLFIQKRCFKCEETISDKADICLADPWLKSYLVSEKLGQSLIAVNTFQGDSILKSIIHYGYIHAIEIDKTQINKSQISTIQRKLAYIKEKRIIITGIKIMQLPIYRSLVLKYNFCFKIHCNIKSKIENHLIQKLESYL